MSSGCSTPCSSFGEQSNTPLVLSKESLEHIAQIMGKDSKTEAKVNTTCIFELPSIYIHDKVWILDTIETNHMCSGLEWLSNLKYDSSKVHLPNGGYSNVEVVGDFMLGNNRNLSGVLYMPILNTT